MGSYATKQNLKERSKMDSRPALTASSATSGFFQSLPLIEPQYTVHTSHAGSKQWKSRHIEDIAFERVLSLYLPSPLPIAISESLHNFARQCLHPDALRYSVDAELSPPRLYPLTTFGEENRSDALWTSEGWRALKDIGIQAGTVALGYHHASDTIKQEWNRRIHQFATVYLFTGSAALVTCPAAMTDGAALLLSRHLRDVDGDQPGRAKVLSTARDKLIQFDPKKAWTSGQWMTERTGGSDVSLTESVAERLSGEQIDQDVKAFGSGEDAAGMTLGPWRVNGYKWFSSATDADMVVLLAKTAKGISTFYAPMRRATAAGGTVMNGVRLVRLKEKLGTRALPTAEVEIRGMRAWLIGDEGKGVKEISAVLNSTRLWTAVGAVGGWARGMAVARAYSRVRKVKNALLQDNPQHVAWMADEVVKQRAASHLVFFGVALQGVSEQGAVVIEHTGAETILPRTTREAEVLLRVLTPVMKAQCSLASVAGLRACMESLGGVGYCENNLDGGIMNIARIFRDTNVNCIWEGTTSVMAEDLVRALKGKGGDDTLDALSSLIRRFLGACQVDFDAECQAVKTAWASFTQHVVATGSEELHYKGHTVLRQLETVLCSCLLMYDAVRTHDHVSARVAKKWISSTTGGVPADQDLGWKDAAALDQEIFLVYRLPMQRIDKERIVLNTKAGNIVIQTRVTKYAIKDVGVYPKYTIPAT